MRESIFHEEMLRGKSIAVLGFGRSGRSVLRYLLSRGCVPTVYDTRGVPEHQKDIYRPNGVSFCDNFPDEFPESVLFRSPGVRQDLPCIRRAMAKGAILMGEVDLFLASTRACVIGVTGSDGKTTTSTLIAALLRAQGKRAVLVGNGGISPLPYLGTLTAADFAVVELSSFQLMTAPAPDVAVLTNLTPNHLNWHTDFEEYAMAKCRILRGCERFVTDIDCAHARTIAMRACVPVTCCTAQEVKGFTPKTGDVLARIEGDDLFFEDTRRRYDGVLRELRVLGAHNRKNLLLAYAAVRPWVGEEALLRVVREFEGVPHRIQRVGVVDGITFINSSIDTSPTRVRATLDALPASPIMLVGGRAKGIPLDPLCETIVARALRVHLFGETAEEIEKGINGRIPTSRHATLAQAFADALAQAGEGDTILLSPGCTAFDQFENFEKRGESFCRMVKELAEERRKNIGTS